MISRDVYIAYPIDQTVDRVWGGMVEYVESALHDAGWNYFDPGDAFTVRQPTPWVPMVNEIARSNAFGVFAFLPMGVPTIGVPVEIERSVQQRQQVVIATDNERSFSLEEYRGLDHVLITGLHEDALDGAVHWLGSRSEQERASSEAEQAEGGSGPSQPLPFVLGPGGRLPRRGYADDAGLDLYVVGNHTIRPGQFVDVPCQLAVELPPWTWGLITGRSSTLRRARILVHSGIIDPGWRGELFAGAVNVGKHDVIVHDGERIAQLILMPNITREFEPVQVDTLSPHPRGQNGFGSTGQ